MRASATAGPRIRAAVHRGELACSPALLSREEDDRNEWRWVDRDELHELAVTGMTRKIVARGFASP